MKRLFLRNIFVRLNKISEKAMKTQTKNILAFINIALLLLFFFGISSCSALQIGKDIKTQLFQENGNVFYISSTYYAKREIVWSYTNDKIIIYETTIKGKILKKRSEFSQQKSFLFDNSANIEANECIELDGDYLGYKIQTPNGQLFSKEHLLNIECFLKTPQNITFLNSLKNEMIKHKIMLYKIE